MQALVEEYAAIDAQCFKAVVAWSQKQHDPIAGVLDQQAIRGHRGVALAGVARFDHTRQGAACRSTPIATSMRPSSRNQSGRPSTRRVGGSITLTS